MAILPEGEVPPTAGTPESEKYLWNFKGLTLELTHNYGSESDDKFEVNNGNVEPHRGFGHIAVMTRDVYASSIELEEFFSTAPPKCFDTAASVKVPSGPR